MLRIHTLIMLGTIAFTSPSAKAQEGSADAPATISRVCLWNADQSTWKVLGLKRAQIVRMNELRLQYPAVVDGQWVAEEEIHVAPDTGRDNAGVDPTLSTSLKGPAAGAAPLEKSTRTTSPETAARSTGLQYQLREVLTPAQLSRWAKECEY